MTEEEVIKAYRKGALPEGVEVAYTPITIDGYGDARLRPSVHDGPDSLVGGREKIQMKYWGGGLYAGYGKVTKTLLIGLVEGVVTDPDPRQKQPPRQEKKPL